MGYFRPDFPKIFLASDWWRASSEIFGKIFGNRRKSVGKASEKRGHGKAKKKKQGGVGGEKTTKKKEGRGGWVMTSSKKIKNKK